MSAQELMDSINEYNEQLNQVSKALKENALQDAERKQLEELQQNLVQLLELTLDQLQHLPQPSQDEEPHLPQPSQDEEPQQLPRTSQDQQPHLSRTSQDEQQQTATAAEIKGKTEEEIRLEQELALFNSEIAELEDVPSSQHSEDGSSTGEVSTSRRRNRRGFTSAAEEEHRPNRRGFTSAAEEEDRPSRRGFTSAAEEGHRHNRRGSTSASFTAATIEHEDQAHHRDAKWSSDASAHHNRVSSNNTDMDGVEEEEAVLPDVNTLLSRSKPSQGGFVKAWTYEEVCSLEGAAVRAPYTEAWGGHTLHNALVLSVDEQLGFDAACPQVLVLFSQPTCLAMLPCRFFLSNSCHYNDGSCQFSHGQPVPVDTLRPYTPPDPSSLVSGCRVLCRHPTVSSTPRRGKGAARHAELWHSGTVEDVLKDEHLVSVDCSVCSTVVQCDLGDAVPLTEKDEQKDGSGLKLSEVKRVSDSRNESSEDEVSSSRRQSFTARDEEDVSAPNASMQQNFLLNPTASGLGEWEKYTKGVGSRLMAAMGYVAGKGLGRDGEGRVEPVPAYLYPAGVSLDRCMELREKSGGQDLLQVEKRLKKEQAQQEQRQQRQEQRLAAQTSVFDIINNRLSGKPKTSKSDGSSSSGPQSTQSPVDVGRQQLKVDTTHALNLKSYQLSKNARLLQQEVDTLTRSWDRQQGGKDAKAAERIQDKLKEKQRELRAVEAAEERINSEQHSRREKKKYVVF